MQLEFDNELLKQNNKKLKRELNQYKQAYQHCVDDLIVLRANNKRLERENEHLKERNYQLAKINDKLYLDNYKIEQENAEQLALLKQFRKLIDYKLTLHQGSSMYREYRSKLDQLGVK